MYTCMASVRLAGIAPVVSTVEVGRTGRGSDKVDLRWILVTSSSRLVSDVLKNFMGRVNINRLP
jgi:hypothetical protein